MFTPMIGLYTQTGFC